MWHPLTIPDVVVPVLKIWHSCGLATFVLENGFFKYKKTNHFVISLLVMLSGLTVYVKVFGVGQNFRSYVTFLHFICIYLQNFALIWFSHRRREKINWVLNEMLSLEKRLVRFSGTTISFVSVGQYLLKYFLLQVILILIVVVAIFLIANLSVIFVIYVVTYYGSMIFGFNLGLFLLFYLLCLRELCKHFNASKITCFKKVRPIYMSIRELSKNFNKCFQGIVLFKIASDFVIAVTSFYLSIYSLKFTRSLVGGIFLLGVSGLSLTTIFIFPFSVAYLFEDLSKQEKLAKKLIVSLLTSSKDGQLSHKPLELFFLQTRHNKIEFNVCGMFLLNCTFIYMIISSMANYLIYTLQFYQVNRSGS
ncbi:gustatory receptor 171 [Tribolium castaneum]|uniref:Gustatory receptor n=1 Tax=Tribolium castaneum TaxID=7070 RepID=D6WBU2_TRICA|nr:gustatory receptor 171 [Tribolium castaneum]